MAAQASWARKLPAVNDNASFEIAYVMSAQLALESGELYGSGSSRIIRYLHNGVYADPGFLLVPAWTSGGRFVGYRPGFEVKWQIDRHAYLQADYRIFYAGQFLKAASPGRNNYMEFWAGNKF
jgi:hypothetical protein